MTISFELFGHFAGTAEVGDGYFDRSMTDRAAILVCARREEE